MSTDNRNSFDVGSNQIVLKIDSANKRTFGEACHDNCSSKEGDCIATSMLAWLASQGIEYDISLNT